MIDFDARMNGVLHQLAPFQLQQLLASLASQTITDSSSSSSLPTDTINPSATSTLTQYQPSVFDFSQSPPTISSDDLISFNQYDPRPPGDGNHSTVVPGQQHEPTVQRQWQETEDIDKDVNAINTTINSFIQTFGLDPTLLEGVDHNESPPTLSSSTGGNNSTMAPSNSDFDFDTFLNNLSGSGQSGSNTGMDYGSIAASSGVGDLTNISFLDEVLTPATSSDMTASPVQSLRQVSPEITVNGASTTNDDSSTGTTMSVMNAGGSSIGTGNSTGKSLAGKKRKSDLIVDFDHRTSAEETKGSSGGKSKKRKDK
jgi:heat shock transcription factor